MSATIGVQSLPKTGRKGPGIGLVVAILAAAVLVAGAFALRSALTSPATAPAKVVTIQTTGTTAVAKEDWLTRAKAAGFEGELGGATMTTAPVGKGSASTQSQTSDKAWEKAVRAARTKGPLG